MIRVIHLPEYLQEKVENMHAVQDDTDAIWIDLHNPVYEELKSVEDRYKVVFPTRQEQEEIEISSRYLEEDGEIYINSTFIAQIHGRLEENDIAFILTEKKMFSLRSFDSKVLSETVKKIKQNPTYFNHPSRIFVSIVETRIDIDADIIEAVSKNIALLSKTINYNANPGKDIVIKINQYQEEVMIMRQVLFDKQRVVSSMMRNEYFTRQNLDILKVIIKDINSLIEHTNFNFTRLEFMQDSFLGLINIEQNKIIKRFTIVSVVFMPPTLIASIYGMNFETMPELTWQLGYPLAILLMLASSIITLYFFKKKKWL